MMRNLRFLLCGGAVLLLAPTRWTQASEANTGTNILSSPQALNEEARNQWADNIMKLSFKQDDTEEPKEKEAMRTCGQGHRGLLTMIIDNSDADARILTVGQLSRDTLVIYSGNVTEKEYNIKDIVMPVETVEDKCFAIREKNSLATVFCARDRRHRDQWLNYIHEAILCKETGVKGRLPAEPGKEMEAAEETLEVMPAEEPSGINLHLAESPLGKPRIVLNGLTIQEMEGLQMQKAVADVLPQPPHPSISDFPNPLAENDPENPSTLNSEGEPKSAYELAALHEAAAEQKEFPITDERTPKAGFAARTMGAE